MENQGFPTKRIEKIGMKFLKKISREALLILKRVSSLKIFMKKHKKRNKNSKNLIKNHVDKLTNERKKMGVKYDPITGLPSNEDTNYNKLLEMWRDEKKKRQEAEGEMTIVKGIGMNSPEMKALKKRN